VVAEVQRLRERGDLHGDLPSLRAVGYRQIWDFLEGHCSAEQMRERAIFATRQLAKRQLTWLRRDWGAQHLYFDEPGLHERVLRCLHGAST
jgi:tRNA A37 N6-isopentenylltransferase MiaA